MSDLTPKIASILKQYMRDPVGAVASCTRLDDLEIDRLDLPMVILDLEDAFDIHIGLNDEIEDLATVGNLAACVASHLTTRPRRRSSTPRATRPWMSTAAEQRG